MRIGRYKGESSLNFSRNGRKRRAWIGAERRRGRKEGFRFGSQPEMLMWSKSGQLNLQNQTNRRGLKFGGTADKFRRCPRRKQDETNTPWYWMALSLYLLLTPVQEFVARCGIQAPLYAFLQGSELKRASLSIVVSNLVFSAVHAHIGLAFALLAFIPGLSGAGFSCALILGSERPCLTFSWAALPFSFSASRNSSRNLPDGALEKRCHICAPVHATNHGVHHFNLV